MLSKKGEAVRRQYIKEGVIVTLFVGCVAALLATLSLFKVSVLGSSPGMFIDAGIFLLLAYGIYRGKGYAGVLAFTLYIVETVYAAGVMARSNSGGNAGVAYGILAGLVVRIGLAACRREAGVPYRDGQRFRPKTPFAHLDGNERFW